MTAASPVFPSPSHDHDGCVRAALDAAELRCGRRGARLTTLRRRVLELVWSSHEPVGAYALLDALKAEGQASAPPTVYRALEFLLDQGLVHRLERLNAFVGCARPEEVHAAQFLICTTCGRVAELDDLAIDAALRGGAEKLGFTVTRQTVEVEGCCPDCQKTLLT
jgi:Fur family zinc uptake transcriptional regulator